MKRDRTEANERHSADYYLPGTPTASLERIVSRLQRLLSPRGRIRAERRLEETNR